MSELIVEGLRASAHGKVILDGVDLVVKSGEVHAIMGPNGSGKSTLSHVLAGRPGYEVLGGSATIDGVEILGLPAWKGAEAGLFLAMQYPTEVPGVAIKDMLTASSATASNSDEIYELMEAEAVRIGFSAKFLERPINVDLSGGEKKRNETLQLGVLRPKFAILDELDSGLDVDALRMVSRRIEQETAESNLGVIAITHYSRLFDELHPDVVHIFVKGRIVESGGPKLADELEVSGYERWVESDPVETIPAANPFADPFADPLA